VQTGTSSPVCIGVGATCPTGKLMLALHEALQRGVADVIDAVEGRLAVRVDIAEQHVGVRVAHRVGVAVVDVRETRTEVDRSGVDDADAQHSGLRERRDVAETSFGITDAVDRRVEQRVGPIGEHGTAIMLARNEFELDASIESDTRSLWPAVDSLLGAVGPELRSMRDATRGGVASVLNELARASSVAMIVRESAVPVHPAVAGAAEILGIDPMYVANEGKLVAFVAPEAADAALAALRGVPGCEEAAEIGEVRTEPPGMVLVETSFGGRRVMDQLVGDPLPRIC
jgi:hypothetical protein